jgi:hypothetical protein
MNRTKNLIELKDQAFSGIHIKFKFYQVFSVIDVKFRFYQVFSGISSIKFLVGLPDRSLTLHDPTKNLIEPKLYMNHTKNLRELKLYMNPTKNLTEPKLCKV